jgi:ATP/maltotriose-dependent transcriptional regulator MalT
LAHAGRFADAEKLAAVQYQTGLTERSVEAQALFSWQLAKTVADRGHVTESVRRAQMAIAMYRQLGRPQFVEFCLIYLSLALSVGHRHAEAVEALAARDALGLAPCFFMGIDLHQARAWAEVAGGNLRHARDQFLQAADEGERIGDLVGAAAALHNIARIGHAKDVTRRLDDLVTGIEGDLAPARAAHTRALTQDDPETLLSVSAGFDAMGADLLGAEAAADAAVAWRRRGDQRRASAAEQHAAWLASRCAGACTPALQAAESRAILTPAEWEAARLAAAGRSNKDIADELFVSVRTIENRLQHVYGKLGVSRRAELAAALATVASPNQI